MFKIAVIFCGLVVCSLGASVSSKFNIINPGSNGRIVGGSEGTIGKFPFLVSIQTYGGHSCGGTLIEGKIVVTAAHCLQFMMARDVEVRAGSTNHKRGGSLVGASRLIVHPEFDTKTKDNDVALIILKSAIPLGENIQTIELANETPIDGTPCVVAGWGTESFYKKDAVPDNLKYTNLKIVSPANCMSDKYAYGKNRIFANMICAAGEESDSCQGDSGGPLVVGGKLAGIISWGFGCAETMFPGVNTNVAMFLDWINTNAKQYLL